MAITIALAGNPNSGKTTLFNTLTGSNQFVGNWPGVTVEKKEGKLKGHEDVTVVDLPGIYSLSPYSPEEVVARNFLIDENPDVILNIVDGTNLERNLFLTTQLTELGIPIVIALNMMDIVYKRGDKLNTYNLAKELGCRVVPISALKSDGIADAVTAALESASIAKTLPRHYFSGGLEHTLAHIEEAVLHDMPKELQRFFAIKLFERDEKITQKLGLTQTQITHIEDDIKFLEEQYDDDGESIIITERYKYIDSIVNTFFKIRNLSRVRVSDKIDRFVTNRLLALPIFMVIMFIVYYVSVTTVGAWATAWAEGVFGDGFSFFGHWVPGIPIVVENFLTAVGCADWLQGLILDGIIAGVGAVLAFVPQLVVLFLFLALLERCGYMARIAFILDRIFRKFGLSGKSFIPILIGTGCGVPGIMASRAIDNDLDRKMTVITTTFIPCAAKLPIIALISGALFGGAWWVAPVAYFIGITAIVCSGVILKKTKLFTGDVSPFIMELPPYHLPTVSSVLLSMWERAWSFIKRAGTVILLAAVVVWFASNFGWENGSFGMTDMDDSILASVGGAVSWIFAPLGWGDWKSAVAVLTGLIAKENIVATLGVLLGYAEVAEDGFEIWDALAANFSVLSGFSFLVFNLLCAPCFAAIGAIRREMNNTKWFWFAIGYQCVFAYAAALCIYQFGMFALGSFGIGTAAAFILTAGFLFLLLRPASRGVLRN